MNVKDITIPWRGTVSMISCRNSTELTFLIKPEEWADYSSGHKAFPSECKKMDFFFGGLIFQRVTYSVQFDQRWNISEIGQMRSYD